MRKVGATASGSVIIEMSPIQYEALQKAMAEVPVPHSTPLPPSPQANDGISSDRKLVHVRNCVLKLKPATVQELIRSIKTSGFFAGGFNEYEIHDLMRVLEQEGILRMRPKGRLVYTTAHAVESTSG